MNLEELQSLSDLSDRTALVTGGAGVLGSQIACALVGCHANVAILDRDQELAQKAIERFPKVVKGRAIRVFGDVLGPKHCSQRTRRSKLSLAQRLFSSMRRVAIFPLPPLSLTFPSSICRWMRFITSAI